MLLELEAMLIESAATCDTNFLGFVSCGHVYVFYSNHVGKLV